MHVTQEAEAHQLCAEVPECGSELARKGKETE